MYGSECANLYSEKIKVISEKNSSNKAINEYCNGKPNFKAMSGIELLILEVPNHWLKKNIEIDELYYRDGIECDEQREYLKLQENYVRTYNVKMVECLESNKTCCSNKSKK